MSLGLQSMPQGVPKAPPSPLWWDKIQGLQPLVLRSLCITHYLCRGPKAMRSCKHTEKSVHCLSIWLEMIL